MKYILKRVAAYAIDIIFVTIVVTLLTSNSYINKDYNKYTKKYDEYNKIVTNYKEFSKDLDKYYKNLTLSTKEYNKINLKEYKTYLEKYKDKKVSEKELKNIKEKCNNHYIEISNNYNYEIRKLSVISSIISILFIMLYFVVAQYYFNGKTIGKKIFKLKVVSNNNNKLNIFNYLIRSLVLNEVIINGLNIVFILALNKSGYFTYNKVAYVVTYVIEMTSIFMIIFDKNHRGFHDYISNTKVIESE